MKIKKMRGKSILIAFFLITALVISTVFGLNAYVKGTSENSIITSEQATQLKKIDCIIVLGCQVKKDGNPSYMLRDRLIRGIELYNQGAAPKIIMSGDHGREDYNEVGTMKKYATDNGVPSEDVFMDHAGFSTYETVYRAKEIFGAKRVVIVTQKYHLYRALFIADRLGVEAYGVSSDYHTYAGQTMREGREILARCKDFIMTIFKPKPTYLGEAIPVNGNGDLTNDKY